MTDKEKENIMYYTHELMYIYETYVEPKPKNQNEFSDWCKRRLKYVNQNIFQFLEKTT